MTPEVLELMRGNIDRLDGEVLIPPNVNTATAYSIRNKWDRAAKAATSVA